MALRRVWWLGSVLFALLPARADVKLNPLFAEHMVLQAGRPVAVWGTADPGETVTVSLLRNNLSTAAEADGRWRVLLPAMRPGGPHVMTVQGKNTLTVADVLIGEVWVCSGQSNMQWSVNASADPDATKAASADPLLRLMTVRRQALDEVPEEVTLDQPWSVCGPDTVGNFSAVGYFFGQHLRKFRNVPVGLISSNYGGTPAEAWTSWSTLASTRGLEAVTTRYVDALKLWPENWAKWQEALAKWRTEADAARAAGRQVPGQPGVPYGPTHVHRPGGLQRAMIAPLQKYAIAGAIWYQGESNAGRAFEYRTLMPAMIRDWRAGWKQGDFPFLLVQLAPFMAISPEPQESAWAELREAQLLTTTALPNVGMAVITDVGEENDIHPKRKQPVGERLALAARAIAYGERIEHKGPRFSYQQIERGRIRLNFTNCPGGLVARGDSLTGFAVCGADRKFYNANARIDGDDEVVVWSDQVPRPVAARFGWANYPVVNLWHKAGLPASPFRTDDFPGTTWPK